MIFKIQRPLVSTEPHPPKFLIYSEDRSVLEFVEIESEAGHDISGYFDPDDHDGKLPEKVYVDGEVKDGELWLDDLVEDQSW